MKVILCPYFFFLQYNNIIKNERKIKHVPILNYIDNNLYCSVQSLPEYTRDETYVDFFFYRKIIDGYIQNKYIARVHIIYYICLM